MLSLKYSHIYSLETITARRHFLTCLPLRQIGNPVLPQPIVQSNRNIFKNYNTSKKLKREQIRLCMEASFPLLLCWWCFCIFQLRKVKQKNLYSIFNFVQCPIIKWLFTAYQKLHTHKNWILAAISFIPLPHQHQHSITCILVVGVGFTESNTAKITKLDLFSISGFRIFLLLHIPSWYTLVGGKGIVITV